MATNVEELKALDLENQGGEQEQEALKRTAQTDRVVRGVNGGVVPRARKLRPLAGIIVIAIVVLAALYMRHGMANRNKKTTKQSETAKVGVGPATNVEKGLSPIKREMASIPAKCTCRILSLRAHPS